MSVQKYDTEDGVRWREHTGRMRSRSFTSKREALALDADIKARRFKGESLPRAGKETLVQAYDDWPHKGRDPAPPAPLAKRTRPFGTRMFAIVSTTTG